MTRLFDAKRGLVTSVDQTLAFSIKNAGKFVLKDGQLLFREQASLDEYNRLMTEVQRWVASEDAITKEAMDKQSASASKLQSFLEKR